MSRLARHRLDIDDALGDRGNIDLEETANEIDVAAAQNDLHLVVGAPHVENDATNALARLMLLTGDLLASRHEAFGPADLDDAVAEMLAYDRPVLFDCLVEKHENCFPMIPSGEAHNKMLLGENAATADAIGAKGAVMV